MCGRPPTIAVASDALVLPIIDPSAGAAMPLTALFTPASTAPQAEGATAQHTCCSVEKCTCCEPRPVRSPRRVEAGRLPTHQTHQHRQNRLLMRGPWRSSSYAGAARQRALAEALHPHAEVGPGNQHPPQHGSHRAPSRWPVRGGPGLASVEFGKSWSAMRRVSAY
jgi:hypothetical protein